MRADKMPGSELPAEGDFSCAAVVVAGGASRRLNHVPKASLSDGTSTLLDCALEAVAAASPRVVVGPESLPLPSGVLRTRVLPLRFMPGWSVLRRIASARRRLCLNGV